MPATARPTRPRRDGGLCGFHGAASGDRLVDRLDVEEQDADVDHRDAVGERVVGLVDDREAVALEPLDQVQLPERSRAVQRRREGLGDRLAELLFAAGRGQLRAAHVVVDVEVGVIDPEGTAELQRRHREPLAQARQQVQAAADAGEELLVAGRLALADQHGADRHVPVGLLVGQERRIERRQPVHMALSHGPSFPYPKRSVAQGLRLEIKRFL